MKNLNKKHKFSSTKKRKPLYPEPIESDNKEYNEKIRLKQTLNYYFRDFKTKSEKYNLKNHPSQYGVLISQNEIKNAFSNIDKLLNKFDFFTDLSLSYNPKIQGKFYNKTNVLLEKSNNPLLKNDYKLRIKKYYTLRKEENIIMDSNINNKIIIKENKLRNKKITKKKIYKKRKEQKQLDNIIENNKEEIKDIHSVNIENIKNKTNNKDENNEEEEYKFKENNDIGNKSNNKDVNNEEEEYKFEENNDIDNKTNNENESNEKEEYKFEENNNIKNKSNNEDDNNEEEEYKFEENNDIENKSNNENDNNEEEEYNFEENNDIESSKNKNENINSKDKSNEYFYEENEEIDNKNESQIKSNNKSENDFKIEENNMETFNNIIPNNSNKESIIKSQKTEKRELSDNEEIDNSLTDEEIEQILGEP